ncbi:glycosyl transferase [Luteimicrobium album]|uniref:Glycosyl transferase n=1 Tax=Luteimicrobium album TaxID=1054550 RepID=A0ABQ6I1W1_9MICO|nr:glycosyl transferase [Luteimicrobium album]
MVTGLHAGGTQSHRVLAIHREVQRESLRQRMVDDPRYQALRRAGVPVSSLGRGWDDPANRPFDTAELARAARLAATSDVILTLKEQPLRLVATDAFGDAPVVACLHRSDPEHSGRGLADLLEAASSGRLAAAVCCAYATRDAYAAAGVPEHLLTVVPNGVDLLRFRPAGRGRRATLRVRTGIPVDASVVVLAARYDTMKDVPLFLAAARVHLAADDGAHVVACGAGMSLANPGLADDVARAFGDRPDLLDRLHLLGVRHDVPSVLAIADVVALTSSFGEAAPLCLIEGAMCGAVPVATDVGDSARIVEGIGLVVARDPEAVAAGWAEGSPGATS